MNTKTTARRLLTRIITDAVNQAVYITKTPTVYTTGRPQYNATAGQYYSQQPELNATYVSGSRLSNDYYVLHEVVGIFARMIHTNLGMGDSFSADCAAAVVRLYRVSGVVDPYHADQSMTEDEVCKALAAILETWVKEITATPMELALAKHRDTILYRLSGICHVFFLGDKKNNDVFHADVFSVLSSCFTQEEKGTWFGRATKDRFGLPISVSTYDEFDWKKWVFNLPEMILRWELENLEEPTPKNTKKAK